MPPALLLFSFLRVLAAMTGRALMPRLTMAEAGEPPPGLQDLIRVWVQLNQKDSHPVGVTVFLELLPRFELGTSSLPRMRSTC